MTPQRILFWTACALLPLLKSGVAHSANVPNLPHAPPGSTVKSMIEMNELKTKSGVASSAPDVIVFEGPPGDGRSGARGIILQATPGIEHNTWTFRYTPGANAYPLQIIHHNRGGQVIVHLDKDGIGTSTPRKWTEIGYNSGDRTKIEKTDAFDTVFPLKDDVEYSVISRLGGRGRYEMWIDGQLVAFAVLDNYNPLSFEITEGKRFPRSGRGPLEFKGANMPLQMEKSWAGLFLGPVGNGVSICREMRFYGEFVDLEGKVVEALPRTQLAAKTATTPAPALRETPSPAPPLQPPVPSASSPSASDLIKSHRSDLVFVTMQGAAGSGFIANYGNGTYLITNAHVAADAKGVVFKTLDGTQVKVGAPAVAVGHDIFLMALPQGGNRLQVMTGVDVNTSIGDEVVVLGNAEGAGVINTITGKIVGLGPNLVEVDAPFQPGNSGSPIIHLKTGKVIGVATYAVIRKYDPSTKDPVKVPVIRRFGYRLDSITSWQPVNWTAFLSQATEMEAIEKLTTDLAAVLEDLARNSRITRGAHNNPVIKNRIDSWLEDRAKRLSPRDASMADQSFLSFLKITCQSDVTAARQHLSYDYFQRKLADQQRERDEIAKVFDETIQNLRKEK